MGNIQKSSCVPLPDNHPFRNSFRRRKNKNIDLFLDIFSALPTSTTEREVFVQVNHDFCAHYNKILNPLKNYSTGSEVRNALASPDNFKLQKTAFDLVQDRVRTLEKMYDFSAKVSLSLFTILNILTEVPEGIQVHDKNDLSINGIVKLNLENHQSLVKQLCQILHFTLRFDERKIANTSLQHDLSFYRRQLTKFRHFTNTCVKYESFLTESGLMRQNYNLSQKPHTQISAKISNTSNSLALVSLPEDGNPHKRRPSHTTENFTDNKSETRSITQSVINNLSDNFIDMSKVTKMSFFFGEASPMMKHLSKELNKYINDGKLNYGKVIRVLSLIISACNVMLYKKIYNDKIKNSKLMHNLDQSQTSKPVYDVQENQQLQDAQIDHDHRYGQVNENTKLLSPNLNQNRTTNLSGNSNVTSNLSSNQKVPSSDNQSNNYNHHHKTNNFLQNNHNNNSNTSSDPDEISYQYVLRILVATLILYDHISIHGSYSKNSGVDIKRSIKTIINFSSQEEQKENLLNTLRFGSIHLMDSNVSDEIKLLLRI